MAYGEKRPMPPPGGVLDGRSWAPLKILFDGLTWRSAIFLLVHMAFGLAYFVALTVSIALSFGLLVVWVGVILAALTMIGWRGGAMLERQFMRAAFGIEIPSPYRKLPEGGLLRKWRALA